MKIQRAWFGQKHKPEVPVLEEWKEIDEDTANRQLANAHGDNAVEKLKQAGTLESRFAAFRIAP